MKRPKDVPVIGKPPEDLVEDLAAILADGESVYLSLGPHKAVLAVKEPEAYAFGESIDRRWAGMSPRERALAVLDWIRRAAQYCRRPKIRYALPEDTVA